MRLIIEDDEGHKTVVPFQRDEITIGRGEGNTVRLTERNVSRHHARLLRSDGVIRVEDLQSYNGVRVNGERVHGSREIHAGDVVQVGDYDVALERDVQPEASPTLGIDDTSPSISLAQPALHPRNLVREIRPVPEAERPRLIVLGAPSSGREFALTKTVVQVGRAPECDVSLDDASLARTHAQLVREGDSWMVLEVSALHAVRVNGNPCTEAGLHDGDVVTLGQVQLRFVAPGALFAFMPEPDREKTTRPAPAPARRQDSRRWWVVAAVVLAALLAVLAILLFRTRLAAAPAIHTDAPEVMVVPGPSVVPGPKLDVEAGSHDLAEAERELAAGHFAAALQAAERAAASGQAQKASPLMERARSEEAAQKAVGLARVALAAGKVDQVMDLLAFITQPSASAGEADELRARAQEPFVKNQLAESRRLLRAGRIPEALAVVDVALKKAPGASDLSSERTKLASRIPPPPPTTLEQAQQAYDEGTKLVAQNQCKQAVTFFKRALQLMPAMAEAERQLGSCYAQLRDGEQAVLHYKKLLALEPDHPSAPAIRRYLDSYQQNMAASPEAQGSP